MKENIYSKVSSVLNKLIEEDRFDLVEIAACAMLLSEKLPIETVDLQLILKELGSDLVFRSLILEEQSHKLFAKNIKKKSLITKKDYSVIMVDKEVIFEEQRFAIAYELAICLINIKKSTVIHEYRAMFLLPSSLEQLIIETFACFLLLPFTSTINELAIFTRKGRWIPEKSSEWLRYIASISEIPYETAIIGFKNIRIVAAYLKNGNFEKETLFEQKIKMLEIIESNNEMIL